MSGRRPGTRPTDNEILSDDCNTCDLLGATAKDLLSKTPTPVSKASKPSNPSTTTISSPIVEAGTSTKSEEPFWEPRKPPGIVEIGNAGWLTLHTFAAYYPDNPTPLQRESASNLVIAFSELFPCRWCADDLKEHLSKHPIKTESRQAFSQWTCEAHNHVNEHLGKPLFDCTQFDRIWRRHQDSLPPKKK